MRVRGDRRRELRSRGEQGWGTRRGHRFPCCRHPEEGAWAARADTGPWMLQQVCGGGEAALGQSFLLAVRAFRLQKGAVPREGIRGGARCVWLSG